VNKFLISYREKIQNLSDEEFDTQKKAIQTIIAEKDTSLAKESSRYWQEISNHYYLFDRQNKELETLMTITKSDFKEYFEKIFFSSETKRLDLLLTSSVHEQDQK
jgi:secreted Zn-dependent insulinase-like peptidase